MKIKPDSSISSADILAAPTAPALLWLKKNQRGLTLETIGDLVGKSINYFRERNHAGADAFIFHDEVVQGLIQSPIMGFTPEEASRFVQLNAQLRRPNEIKPDPSITREQLMQADRVGVFLELKAKQLGINKMELHGLADICQVSMAAIRFARKDSRQLTEASLQLLTKGLELDTDESARMRELNALEKPSQNRFNTKANRLKRAERASGAVPVDAGWSEKLSERLFMLHYGSYPEDYVLPTPDMLAALDAGDAARWNTLRQAQSQDDGQLLYLRGYSKKDGAAVASIAGFDLSHCDLTDVKWAPVLQTAGASLAGSALADIGRDPDVYAKQMCLLPLALQRLYDETHDPARQIGQSAYQGPVSVERLLERR